jgi:hypothetical protein
MRRSIVLSSPPHLVFPDYRERLVDPLFDKWLIYTYDLRVRFRIKLDLEKFNLEKKLFVFKPAV